MEENIKYAKHVLIIIIGWFLVGLFIWWIFG